MIRVVAAISWFIVLLAHSAQACSPKSNSTFCADGWVAQPMGRVDVDRRQASEQAGDRIDDGSEQNPLSGDEIYVEGAVTIGEPPAGTDAPL
jgi:hypothetical protein